MPERRNALRDFVTTGEGMIVVPLTSALQVNETCLRNAPKHMPRDVRFMADRMKVPVPPLPVVTKEEMAEYKAKVSSFRAMDNSARQGPGALTRFLSYSIP